MRHKIKIINKLLIFGIAILLSSCSEDLYETENTFNKQGIKISKVSLKEPRFQNKSKLIKQVNKVKSKKELSSNANRMVFDSINNFYFDDENGMLIETTNGYESYTFKIERETPNNYELENIVFSKIGAEYDVTLVKYELTPTEIEKLQNNILFEPTVQPNIEVLSRVMACNTRIDYCRAVYDPEGAVIGMLVTYLNPCEGSDGGVFIPAGNNGTGGTESGSGTGNGTGTGNSGTGGLNPIDSGTGVSWEGGNSDNTYSGGGSSGSGEGLLTVPTGGASLYPIASDPCVTLTKAKNEPKVQTAIDDLKTKTTGEQEFAYEIERRKSLVEDSGFAYNTILKTGTGFSANPQTGGYVQGQAHNHPINGVAIPSWDDIYWTQLCEEDNTITNNGTAFNIIVSPDPANPGSTILYAITIDNIEALQLATAAVFGDPDILETIDYAMKREKIMKMFEEKFAPLQNNTNAQETTYLQTFATYGITLSKFNNTTGKWEKLKKDPANPNNVIKEPCN